VNDLLLKNAKSLTVEQTTLQVYQLIAVCTVLIIGIFFLIICSGKKEPTQLVTHNMKVDYIKVNNSVRACCCEKQLKEAIAAVDAFFVRHHKSDKDNKDLMMYYTFLLRSLSEKKSQINAIEEITA
jgi:hypothetical protein